MDMRQSLTESASRLSEADYCKHLLKVEIIPRMDVIPNRT